MYNFDIEDFDVEHIDILRYRYRKQDKLGYQSFSISEITNFDVEVQYRRWPIQKLSNFDIFVIISVKRTLKKLRYRSSCLNVPDIEGQTARHSTSKFMFKTSGTISNIGYDIRCCLQIPMAFIAKQRQFFPQASVCLRSRVSVPRVLAYCTLFLAKFHACKSPLSRAT
jgi:hypothetical protein